MASGSENLGCGGQPPIAQGFYLAGGRETGVPHTALVTNTACVGRNDQAPPRAGFGEGSVPAAGNDAKASARIVVSRRQNRSRGPPKPSWRHGDIDAV